MRMWNFMGWGCFCYAFPLGFLYSILYSTSRTACFDIASSGVGELQEQALARLAPSLILY